jgi:hypothetical protein
MNRFKTVNKPVNEILSGIVKEMSQVLNKEKL